MSTGTMAARTGALLLGALLLVSCSGGGGTGAPGGGSDASGERSAAKDGTTEYPLTLESDYGDTVLEERPERIAVVGYGTAELDAVLALGVDPVFALPYEAPWIDAGEMDRIGQEWVLETGADGRVEEQNVPALVAESDPDLIISLHANSPIGQHTFDDYAEIAPVLFAQAGDNLHWDDMTLRIGEALDLSGTAEGVVEAVNARIAEVAEAHPDFATISVSHVIVRDEEYGAGYQNLQLSGSTELLDRLGFASATGTGLFERQRNRVTSDTMIWIDAELLLMSTVGESDTGYLFDSEEYLSLPAVAEGRVQRIDVDDEYGYNTFVWALDNMSPLNVPWIVDELVGYAEIVEE